MSFVRNATAALSLAAFLVPAGCSRGENGASGFDSAGAAADASALESVWTSQAARAFLHLAPDINTAVGADQAQRSGAVAPPAVSGVGPAAERRAATETHARTLAGFLTGRSTPAGSAVLLPSEHLGTTWVWNRRASAYAVGGAAAPDDRIRFVLYALGDGPGGLADPLAPIGHVDLIERSSGATGAVQVLVADGDATIMDYRLSATGGARGGDVDVLGYVTDGVGRLEFDLRNALSATGAGASLTSDNTLELARRGAVFHYDLAVRLGDSSLAGYEVDFAFEANGERYATIRWDDAEGYVLAGAEGRVLSGDEVLALEHAFEVWNYGLGLVETLTRPIGAFFTL